MSSKKTHPLQDLRVVVTRPLAQARAFRILLEKAGARVFLFPSIEISPLEGEKKQRMEGHLRRAQVGDYDGILFTSTNAVTTLKSLLEEMSTPLRKFPGRIFCIGPKTQRALNPLRVKSCIPEVATAEGMFKFLEETFPKLEGKSFLFPQAEGGRTYLQDQLRLRGARVDVPVAYRTQFVQNPSRPLPTHFDWLTFTSPSCVEGYRRLSTLNEGVKIAVIGPTTQKAVQAVGWPVHACPEKPSLENMIRAMSNPPSGSDEPGAGIP